MFIKLKLQPQQKLKPYATDMFILTLSIATLLINSTVSKIQIETKKVHLPLLDIYLSTPLPQ